jgi:TnpA family transposase
MYALLLKYFEGEGRFADPEITTKTDPQVVKFLAGQLNVPFIKIEWPSVRTYNRFRVSIRTFLGYREISPDDKADLSAWLFKNVFPHAPDEPCMMEAAVIFCRHHKIELFAKNKMERFLSSVTHSFEGYFKASCSKALSDKTRAMLEQLIEEDSDNEEEETPIENSHHKNFTLNDLKKDTSQLKKESVLYEIAKYECLKGLQLSENLALQHSRKLLLKYTERVKTRVPSDLRAHADVMRHSQLAIFCTVKMQQSADTLADMLLKILGRIQRRAELFVDKHALSELKKVTGKSATLLTLAQTLNDNPKETIENAVYPKVPKVRLEAIIKELHHPKWYQNQVRVKALSLYSHGRRQLLRNLIKTLTFDTQDLHELLQAINWVITYENTRSSVDLPYQSEILKSWGPLIQCAEDMSMDLKAYELAVLCHFATALSVKNIWVTGAHRYQSPAKDTPSDFEDKKDFYFEWLDLPQSADDFINPLKDELEKALLAFNESLPGNDKVTLSDHKNGRIKLSPSAPQDAPKNLNLLHQDINRLWPNVAMIDILKEVDFRVGFSKNFTSLGAHRAMSPEKLQKRLLLCLYGLGSNLGLKRMSTSHTGESYGDLRYVKSRYISANNLRSATKDIVNAILTLRDPRIWGEASVGCACDSKRFNVWEQNIFAGWHGRYRSHGLMVYTHIDTQSTPIFMQVTRPGDSEVGAMLAGCLNHDTDMNMNEIFTDTHGQSCIGFAFSHLLKFDLMPRIKGINKQKLYIPSKGLKEKLPHLSPILSSESIHWSKIKNNYEQIVKYAAALKTKTVDADVLLKRLSAGNAKDPSYQALLEIGKAKRTIFLCRYLSDESLRIKINEFLNMVELFNGLMGFIFHGKQGQIASNDREDQELSILALHLIQVCIVYMNTLIIQEILSDPLLSYTMMDEDLRALTALIHAHINPHGIVILDMNTRMNFKNNHLKRQA